MLMLEAELRAAGEKWRRRQLSQQRFFQHEAQARVATGDRMAHLITLARVEEQNMVRVRHRLIASDVPRVEATIRKHEVSLRRALLGTPVPAGSAAADVPDRNGLGLEEAGDFEVGHCARL
jgi:hypothetical protein